MDSTLHIIEPNTLLHVAIFMGASGSGKSAQATKLGEAFEQKYPGALVFVCSADNYPGLYTYKGLDFAKLGDAHAASLRHAISGCGEAIPCATPTLVIVDNTNTTPAEISPYIQTARAFGCEPRIISVGACDADLNEYAARNSHGTPLAAIVGQHERISDTLADWPPFWPKVECINNDF